MSQWPDSPPPFEYPMEYTFRVLAHAQPDLAERVALLVQSIVGPLPEGALTETPSREGKYRAIHVSCLLVSEEQRRDVYLRLRAEAAVIMTL